jgi:UDP-glucuronate decarboxylase
MARQRKSVLVTGGAGFIGSNLCDALLESGARVFCLDSFVTGTRENVRRFEREPRFELIEADITEPLPKEVTHGLPALGEIYNLACAASPPAYQALAVHTMMTNVVGTQALLSLAKDRGARFLQASTSEIYGDPEVHPQHEDYRGNVNCYGPRACYDEGKRAAETLCFDYRSNGDVDARIVRIFNTYGPRMRADDGRVVSNAICQALSGQSITIFGDGAQTRSFCYVDDLVDGIRRLMHHEGDIPGPVNLGNPDEMPITELADRVIALTGSSAGVTYRPLPVDDPRRRRPDIGRARSLLGWSPQVSLEEGLKPTIEWFRSRLTALPPGIDGRAAAGTEWKAAVPATLAATSVATVQS